MKLQNKKQLCERAAAIGSALILWHAASVLIGQQILLASPLQVIKRLGLLCTEGEFWRTVGFSFLRIEAGFFLGLFLGCLLAVLSSRFHLLEIALWPYVTVIKSVPVASFIIICLIWINASGLSVFISFLMVFPVVYFNVLQGMKSTDKKMLQMADTFQMSWRKKMLYIFMPQVKPFLFSACSTALGISWKAGIAAEVIGIPDGSVGERLYEAKIYLSTADLFAWTVVIVVISALFEKVFLKILELGFERLEKL